LNTNPDKQHYKLLSKNWYGKCSSSGADQFSPSYTKVDTYQEFSMYNLYDENDLFKYLRRLLEFRIDALKKVPFNLYQQRNQMYDILGIERTVKDAGSLANHAGTASWMATFLLFSCIYQFIVKFLRTNDILS
jgi:hypothetical protein